jgi:dCTP diphosphatase
MSEKIDVKELKKSISKFAQAREWEKFHTPKNIVMALSVEASELLELFQWLTPVESTQLNKVQKAQVADELSDVIVYATRLADLLDINLKSSIKSKMKKNARKYPAKLVKGSAKKYTEYKKKGKA